MKEIMAALIRKNRAAQDMAHLILIGLSLLLILSILFH